VAGNLLTEHETGTGVGVDLFMKKNKPGPTVGVGYTIEVFENGIKVDEIKAKDKKEWKKIIDDFKAQYNTGRAFQNENQLHITYKTKDVINPPVPKEGPEDTTEKREEFAMQAIDQVLIKQASKIRNYLQRLIDPTAPVIIKRAEEIPPVGGEAAPAVVPMTPGNESPVNVLETAVKNAVIEVVKYVKENAKEPKDVLYNGIKHWISEVKKNIKNWERMEKQTIDRKQLTQRIMDVVQSGDPAKIKKVSGTDITPEQAIVLQEVTLMEIGTPAQGKVSGGGVAGEQGVDTTEKTNMIDALKTSASLEDTAFKILGEVHSAPESNIVGTASTIVKELLGGNPGDMEEIVALLPETFEGTAINRAIQELQAEYEKENTQRSTPTIEIKIKEFWENVSKIKTAVVLEDAFVSWVLKDKVAVDFANEIWKKINADISAIRNKQARLLPEPMEKEIFDPYVNSLVEFIKNRKTPSSIETGKILDAFKSHYIRYLLTFATFLLSREGHAPEFKTTEIEMANKATALKNKEDMIMTDFTIVLNERVIDPVTHLTKGMLYKNAANNIIQALVERYADKNLVHELFEEARTRLNIPKREEPTLPDEQDIPEPGQE